MSRATAFYDAARWYDLLHAPDTEAELAPVLAFHERLGNGGRDVLEPACGTGRYLEALAKKGFQAAGYDLNAKALAFARRRLAPYKGRARVLRGDMRSFSRPGAFDLAFCPLSSIRHLLTEGDVRRHLRATARSLRPGGLYVVGLDLCDYAAARDDEETWEVGPVRHVMETFAPVRRRERVLHFLSTPEGLIESEYELRSYSRAEWERTVAGAGLRVVGEAGGFFALQRA